MKVRITYENKATEKKEYENIIESVCQEGAYIYGL
ncbi:MAG: rRNA maturation RNase YbeY, partial [Megasphaera micronuciformis]|nr:rRNA maturation RNase YbeY [Megasphaera micronuciformis]